MPSVCQRQEQIITTAQETVGVPPIQSEDQCRRVTSCSADGAVRVLMGGVPGDCSWWARAAGQCSLTSLVQRVQMIKCPRSSLLTSPDVSEDNRHSVMSTRKGVNSLTKEECVFKQSPWRVEEARVVQACFDTERAAAASQHSGVSTRSRCESERVKSCMSEAWTREAPNRTRQQQ